MPILQTLHPLIRNKNQIQNRINKPFRSTLSYWTGLFSMKVFLLLALSLAFFTNNLFAAKQNNLINHPSPYLAMHGNDPVDWQDWSAKILKFAQDSNKPILISSGYFACHWCHVMQKENYKESAAADLMNQHFVSVKLDREMHSDLDSYLLEFARQLTGRAGWPQHVVLTPQGYPFAAFGYLPNQQYQSTLVNINQAWQKQANQIMQMAQQATLQTSIKPSRPINYDEFRTALLNQLENNLDDLSGGLQGSSKFPKTPLLLALLEISPLSETQQAWLELTFEQMQNEHLQDHINGGFYRYTVDPEWQIPHFEKMGYDNALLAQAYFVAGHKFKRTDFIQTGQATLAYMEQHLFNPEQGLFTSSQSALDHSGNEGGPYLFTKQQLENKLQPDTFNYLIQNWQLNQTPPYELGWHPSPTDQYWEEIKLALNTPVENIPRDSKHILSWNGLALSAYAHAYQSTQKTVYLKKANALSEQLIKLLQQASPPRALDKNGQNMGLATLEDFAYILKGLKDLNNSAPNTNRQQLIVDLNKTAQKLFLNPLGWQTNQQPLLPGQTRQASLIDDATPSASALLECATSESESSRNSLFAQNLRQHPLSYPSYLQVLQCQASPTTHP
ncbi:MAG: DUF255 domain-containing protein [Pseudomonadota bacterium]|nr:DUF255 domain-containing protein [Pseudomonadota bacterium]